MSRKLLFLPGLILLALIFFLPCSVNAKADAALELLRKAAQTARTAEGSSLGEYKLKDQDGQLFTLSEYGGKPLIVSFIFTKCPDICNTVVATLAPAMEAVRKELGDKFNAVVVGFDAENDTPEAMRSFGMGHSIDFNLVRFASGDVETISRMTKDFGFYFETDEEIGFNHLGLVSIVDKEGVIYRQVYRTDIRSGDIKVPLEELLTDERQKSSPTLLMQIKSLCLKYDPETGEYSVDYGFILGIVLQAIVVAICFWLGLKNEIKGFFKKIFSKA